MTQEREKHPQARQDAVRALRSAEERVGCGVKRRSSSIEEDVVNVVSAGLKTGSEDARYFLCTGRFGLRLDNHDAPGLQHASCRPAGNAIEPGKGPDLTRREPAHGVLRPRPGRPG